MSPLCLEVCSGLSCHSAVLPFGLGHSCSGFAIRTLLSILRSWPCLSSGLPLLVSFLASFCSLCLLTALHASHSSHQLVVFNIFKNLNKISKFLLFIISIKFVLGGVHCSIYKCSYNVSNIPYLNSPHPLLSFIPLSPNSWNSFNKCHSCIYTHVNTLFALYSPYYPPNLFQPPVLRFSRRKNIKRF
jgi:hypothetical protein